MGLSGLKTHGVVDKCEETIAHMKVRQCNRNMLKHMGVDILLITQSLDAPRQAQNEKEYFSHSLQLIFLFMTIGVFIARGKEDALVTKNIVPGETVYGEKKISVDAPVRYIFFFFFFTLLVIQ